MSNRLSVCPIHRRLFWTAVMLSTTFCPLCAVSRYVVFNAERSDLADSLSRNAT